MGTEAAETRDTSFKMAGKKAREAAREAAREDAKVEEEGTEAGGKGEVEGKDDGTGTGAVAGADGVEAEERYEWPVRGHDMELIKTIIPTADEVPREKDGRKEGATRLMSDYLEARGAVRGERTGVIAPGTRPRGTMVYRCECGSKVMVHGNIDGDKYEDWARCPKCGKKVG